MLCHKVRVVRLLFVVNDHRLDVRKHVLPLSKASVLHLAFLNALHTASIFNGPSIVLGGASVFLIRAAGPAATASRLRSTMRVTSVHKGINLLLVVLHGATGNMVLACWPVSRVVSLGLLRLLRAIVSTIALCNLVVNHVTMVLVTMLHLINALL